MYNLSTTPKDQLKGEKIFAKFRKKTPPEKPVNIINKDGPNEKSYTLTNTVICTIEKPFRRKKS